ncbi:TetR/AcrR family transcriptional regulator [bacterium AH-315-P15]|nr:TetR/AcrR family transcriptional regulator [bacterium AH-315-P15]
MKAKPFQIGPDAPPAKQAILRAALKLFAARGIDGVTIRDVAAEAEFTNPALYKHYKSKEAMAADLFETCYREMVARMEPALKSDLTFHRALDHYLSTLMELYEDAPEALDFVNDNLPRFWPEMPKELKSRTQVTHVRELLKQGRKEGAVTKDQPLEMQVVFVMGMINQLSRMARQGGLSKPITAYRKEGFAMLEKLLA